MLSIKKLRGFEYILNVRVVRAILKLLAFVLKVKEVLVGHDIACIFTIRD